jgi:hypothetical protein
MNTTVNAEHAESADRLSLKKTLCGVSGLCGET